MLLPRQNHDTGSTLNHWPFPWNHLHEGYAYILTHPGTLTVFYDHFFADGLGDSIRELIKIRTRNGLHCRSKVRVPPSRMQWCHWVGVVWSYARPELLSAMQGPTHKSQSPREGWRRHPGPCCSFCQLVGVHSPNHTDRRECTTG